MEKLKLSDEDIREAGRANIVDLAKRIGLTPKKIGSYYTLEEHDSIRIFPPYNSYVRFSDHSGGDAITFVRNMDLSHQSFTDAVAFILGQDSLARVNDVYAAPMPVPFKLPESSGRTDTLYRYLTKERGLSEKTVDFFYEHRMIYEDTHKNVVFVGRDPKGVAKHAAKRGTSLIGKTYKQDSAGSDKAYSFNLYQKGSGNVVVTEAPIDLMSYVELTKDTKSSLVSLGGTGSKALMRFLKDHPDIEEVHLLLDCDIPGTQATVRIKEELRNMYSDAITVYDRRNKDVMADTGCKDINEYLLFIRKGERPVRKESKESSQGDLPQVNTFGGVKR